MTAFPSGATLAPGTAVNRPCGVDVSLADLVDVAEVVRNDPAALRTWLTRVLSNPVDLDLLAARSYLHSNGFAKIVLHTSVDHAVKVRLHVWEDEVGPRIRGESDPHGHRWRFVSTVVAGRGLDVVHLVEGDDGEGFERYEYDPDGGHHMLHAGHRSLRVVHESCRGLSDVYLCDTDVVHTIEPVGHGMVATVVVQGPDTVDAAPVYRRTRDSSVAPRLPLTTDELVRFLEPVVDSLRS